MGSHHLLECPDTLTEKYWKARDIPFFKIDLFVQSRKKNGFLIFTDWSKVGKSENTGAGIYSTLISPYAPLGREHVPFDTKEREVWAVLNQLVCQHTAFSNAVKTAISNHTKPPSAHDTVEVRELIKLLFSLKKHVVLQWILSHCGISGNENADQLDKRGANIPPLHCKVPYNRSKTVTNHDIQQNNF
jgi:RNase H.